MNRAIILLVVILLGGCREADNAVVVRNMSYETNAVDVEVASNEIDANLGTWSAPDIANSSVANMAHDAPADRWLRSSPAASTNATTNADAATPTTDVPGVEQGFAAFGQPPDMEIDRWYTLEFVAGPTKTRIKSATEGRPLTTPSEVLVAPWMRVTLLDDRNFEIVQKGKAEKPTGADKTATWQWNVRPVRDGSHSLYAQVEVLKRHPDGSFETVEEYNRLVAVKVEIGTWAGFVLALRNATSASDAFGTLFRSLEKTLLALAALIVAFGLVAWRLGLRRKKPEKEPPATDQ